MFAGPNRQAPPHHWRTIRLRLRDGPGDPSYASAAPPLANKTAARRAVGWSRADQSRGARRDRSGLRGPDVFAGPNRQAPPQPLANHTVTAARRAWRPVLRRSRRPTIGEQNGCATDGRVVESGPIQGARRGRSGLRGPDVFAGPNRQAAPPLANHTVTVARRAWRPVLRQRRPTIGEPYGYGCATGLETRPTPAPPHHWRTIRLRLRDGPGDPSYASRRPTIGEPYGHGCATGQDTRPTPAPPHRPPANTDFWNLNLEP